MKNKFLQFLSSMRRGAAMLIMLLTLGVGQMWGAWTGNAGICVNGTWYKASSNIDGGNWLNSQTTFNGTNLGAITSLELGGEYQNWDDSKDDACGWNSNNGIWITITTNSGTSVDAFKLSCYRDGKSGNNNVWKTTGSTGTCGDGSSWAAYSVDISGYAAGVYKLKVHWFSASGVALPSSGDDVATFTINPVVTFKANGGTGSDYTQTVTYNTATALTDNTFSRDGYTFAGWATSSGGSVVYTNGANVTLTAHTDLYAVWYPYFCDTELSATSGTTGAGTDISLTCSVVDSKYRITVKGTGLTSISAGVYYKYGGVGDGHQLINDATLVTNSSTNITYDIPANAKTPVFYTNLFVVRASESAYNQIKDKTIDWSYSCGITNYSVTYNGSSASGSVPTDNSVYTSGDEVTVLGKNTLSMDNYSFSGWNTSSNMSGTDRAVSSTFNISANTTLYAKWTQTITLHANTDHHGTGANSSATAVWNKASVEGFSATTGAVGYTLDGYYTDPTSGTKVLNANGSFANSNVTGYITSGKWSRTEAAPTLYAHWVADTWDLYSNTTKLGAFINTSTDEYRLNINITNDNQAQWHFLKNNSTYYYTGAVNPINENVTLGIGAGMIAWQGGSTGHYTLKVWKSSSIWYLRAYASPQVNYTAAPTGGTVAVSSNWDGALSAGDYAMYGSNVTFTATPATGYTFEGWYGASDFSGEKLSTNTTLTVNGVTSATNRYAKFEETMSSLTTSNSYDAGTPGYAAPTVSNSATDVGYATTRTITATAAGTGYTFAGWTLTNCTRTDGGGPTANPITICSNGDGAAVTVVANYEEDLSSPWTLKGGTNLTGNDWATAYNLTKKSGHSTESVAYYTLSISSTNSGISGSADDWSFKLINSETWYGLTAEGSWWWQRSTKANKSLTTSGQNIQICADVAGNYEVKVDYSTPASPTVTVIFPTSYTLTYSIGDVNGTSGNISTSPSTESGSKVLEGSSITLTAPNEKSGYTWKGWYLNAEGSGVQQCATKAYAVTMNADKTLYACYTENSYSTTVASNGNGSVSPSGSVNVKQVTGTVITATPSSNYVFDHWTTSGGGITATSALTVSPNTFKATSASGTITAYFDHQWCLKGDQWDSWSTSKGLPNTGTNTYSASFTLTKGQKYKFKVHDRKTNTWYGNTKDAGEHAMERGDAAYGTATNGGNDDNLTITPDVTGDYTFSFNTSTKKITVTYPTAYTVTFGAGTINGSDAAISASATPSFSSGDYVLPETDITFSKGSTKDGYTWKGWYSDQAGSATLHEDDDDDFTWSATRTGNISVYACYNFITYDITYNLNSGTNHPSNPATFNVETSTITLQNPTRTGYTFGGWYDNSSLTGDAVTTIAKGTHEDQEFWAKWTAKTYTITLNQNGATTESDPTSLTATYDGRAGGTSDQFTLTNPEKTGYTFAGWYESEGGTGAEIITTARYYKWEANPYVTTTGLWQHDGNVTVYAKWTPNDYAVTLSTTGETGYGSNAPANQTATFGAGLPTITPPTGAAGYKFQGYFTAANGAGTQYYNANGTSAHAWDIASGTTLHAYFQKTVISTLEHPASIAKGDVVTLDVNPVLNQTGATDYMDICWSLLYDNDNPVESGVAIAANPVDGKPNQVRYTLTGLSAGYYKVKAVLKANASSFDACDAGTELSTLKSNLRIAGNSNVTILYQDASGNTIRENGAVEVARGETVEVTAPEIIGYSFATWVLGDVLATEDELTDNPITISAEYDGILIAKYNRKNTIYFKNTLNWPAVYVNLLSSGFWNANGSGNTGHANRNIAMTQLGTSDIWYYEYGETSTSDYVSFTSQPQANATNFWGKDTDPKVMVVYPTRPNYDANERTAYGFHVNTPMFVPLAGQTAVEKNINNNGRAYYYNQGYWAKYEPINKETGYTLKIYNKKNNAATPDAGQAPVLMKSVPFTFNGDMTLPVSVTVDLEAGKWYGFKIYRDKGNTGDALSWYGNGGDMSNKHSGDFDKGEAVWEFKSTQASNCGLQTTSAGDYVFTLAYGKELSTDSMQYLVGVHYPEAAGDYRLVYSDDNRTGILSTTIPYNSEADTLSFFVDVDADPSLALQKCAVSYDGGSTTTVTWTDTIADLFSGGLPAAISESGVYYFCINRNTSGKKELGDVKLYTGNFYIRTDGATPSKWDNFRQNNHLMAYSDYADLNENFTHSYTQWYDLTNRRNVKFTVANDYSVSISDTLIREEASGTWVHIADYIDTDGNLNRSANVRFMYNDKTNAISRAYIDGAYEAGGNFLKILARTQDSIYAAAEGGDPLTEITFTDNGNWLYEQTVYAQPGARYKLRSLFGTTDGGKHVITQYFKGNEGSTAADSATMIGGNGSSRMPIRLLYDFKTNRVVAAYKPSSGTINENLEINADIMFMREHQEDIEQITFASGKSISEIENIYCGLRFNKWTLNNKSKEVGHATLSPLLSRYERDLFYVSFPYDVRLSDVIGFGTYGQHWIIEYYDGAARAKNGFWADSESYWKFVTPSMKDTFELKAGTGYIVALDLDELYYISEEVHASIWNNTDISDLELLFPGNVSSISNVDVTYNMPSHECKINRGTASGNRTIKDSHWNVLGVPTFKNITGEASGEPDEGVGSGEIVFANKAWVKDSLKMKFIYDGNLSDNSLTAKAVKDFEFKAMHAYVVQYCGNVTFTTSATPAPASVAARTYAEEPIDVDFRLELNKDGVLEDQTFVSMTNNEDASADFVFGEDLSKEFNNSRANIYTFIGTEWAAGNTLPMSDQTTVVPVGIKIASTGDYTFAIPDGTNGVGVTLIDNETGVRTSLSALDYTINLSAGTYDNRFVLEISPVHQSPTGVELLNGENGENGVRKVLIDNILYIVKDGVMYDARGSRVQ